MTPAGPSDSDPEADAAYVEYCLANVTCDVRGLLEASDASTRGVACLDRCGRCHRTGFLVVDGTPIEGERRDRFLAGLREGDPE